MRKLWLSWQYTSNLTEQHTHARTHTVTRERVQLNGSLTGVRGTLTGMSYIGKLRLFPASLAINLRHLVGGWSVCVGVGDLCVWV